MAIAARSRPVEVEGEERSSRGIERYLSPLLLSPSIVALLVFVYGFIAMTIWISISNWNSAGMDLTITEPILSVYDRLFNTTRFQISLRNSIIFTVLFLFFAVGLGLLLAVMLDQQFKGRAFFRNIFLFPYALSFVVTGVAWRWIFNPETGINLLIENLGINALLDAIGLGPFAPAWLTDPKVVGDLAAGLDFVRAQIGLPLALIPVIIAATWQLSGFAMAMYLAGLGAISEDIREAAALDGATTLQTYRDIIIPLLKPITVSTMIILGHVSLKIFDLIYAMSGSGPGFATDVPGIFVFDQTFGATRYNLGAAASIIMLLLVSLVIVPYLARSIKDL